MVKLWIRGELNPQRVEGGLRRLTEELNEAANQGMRYAVLMGQDGLFMVQTSLITLAKEEDDDADISW